ncbi:purine-binding chemotaxis protein CheW [Spongiibacter sp. KMU-158]|uniref:Purine-binding chemotaxis protein CheW n=1 Tax=Spongiibacter pelagi TaxID=2760804 RepID=A0A927C010_9GAMM|nr:chemotaxis protein CheW [Spongiibacter pelagi]MBD2857382.1 purine-binding chemotaxis protein CheW [Spongiibacter pelagi]
MDVSLSPFEYLRSLSQLAGEGQQRSPSLNQPVENLWSGVGFALAGHSFVVPMGEVSEVLVEPNVTRIPGVKTWVKGVANIRGRLLPMIDLGAFLGLESRSHRNRRVLVCENDDFLVGLLVDEVLGMQYFQRRTYFDSNEDLPAELGRFIQGGYRVGENAQTWLLFKIARLFDDYEFLNVAA